MSNFKTTKETHWKNYMIKAEQFFEAGRDAFIKESWNAVGLNAVHTAISANDAVTSYYKNVRSVSEKHGDAVKLFLEVFNNNEESKKMSNHLSWLISRKNLVEYETRLFFKKEAEEALKHAERFLIWSNDKLPKA